MPITIQNDPNPNALYGASVDVGQGKRRETRRQEQRQLAEMQQRERMQIRGINANLYAQSQAQVAKQQGQMFDAQMRQGMQQQQQQHQIAQQEKQFGQKQELIEFEQQIRHDFKQLDLTATQANVIEKAEQDLERLEAMGSNLHDSEKNQLKMGILRRLYDVQETITPGQEPQSMEDWFDESKYEYEWPNGEISVFAKETRNGESRMVEVAKQPTTPTTKTPEKEELPDHQKLPSMKDRATIEMGIRKRAFEEMSVTDADGRVTRPSRDEIDAFTQDTMADMGLIERTPEFDSRSEERTQRIAMGQEQEVLMQEAHQERRRQAQLIAMQGGPNGDDQQMAAEAEGMDGEELDELIQEWDIPLVMPHGSQDRLDEAGAAGVQQGQQQVQQAMPEPQMQMQAVQQAYADHYNDAQEYDQGSGQKPQELPPLPRINSPQIRDQYYKEVDRLHEESGGSGINFSPGDAAYYLALLDAVNEDYSSNKPGQASEDAPPRTGIKREGRGEVPVVPVVPAPGFGVDTPQHTIQGGPVVPSTGSRVDTPQQNIQGVPVVPATGFGVDTPQQTMPQTIQPPPGPQVPPRPPTGQPPPETQVRERIAKLEAMLERNNSYPAGSPERAAADSFSRIIEAKLEELRADLAPEDAPPRTGIRREGRGGTIVDSPGSEYSPQPRTFRGGTIVDSPGSEYSPQPRTFRPPPGPQVPPQQSIQQQDAFWRQQVQNAYESMDPDIVRQIRQHPAFQQEGGPAAIAESAIAYDNYVKETRSRGQATMTFDEWMKSMRPYSQ